MEAHLKLDNIINTFITVFGIIAGAVSTLDTLEQIGRIILVFISICSGILLIVINWNKAVIQVKKWIKKP